MDVFIGFDSAWTDNQKAPGAICAITWDRACFTFYPPELASFEKALSFVRKMRSSNGLTLLAIDQPTIVPNVARMRPVERVAASAVSWLGGGVQPSNRGKVGMFCDASPIWHFLEDLKATEDPERARKAAQGLHIIEVFPALALGSLSDRFYGYKAAPKYNPANRAKFRPEDWTQVAKAAAREADAFDCGELANWCRNVGNIIKPTKADQDKLDSALCILIALRWRFGARQNSILLGDINSGYMVSPVSEAMRTRLTSAAPKYSVAIDGALD